MLALSTIDLARKVRKKPVSQIVLYHCNTIRAVFISSLPRHNLLVSIIIIPSWFSSPLRTTAGCGHHSAGQPFGYKSGKRPFLNSIHVSHSRSEWGPAWRLFKKIDTLRELRSCDACGYPWVPSRSMEGLGWLSWQVTEPVAADDVSTYKRY